MLQYSIYTPEATVCCSRWLRTLPEDTLLIDWLIFLLRGLQMSEALSNEVDPLLILFPGAGPEDEQVPGQRGGPVIDVLPCCRA